MSKRPVGLFLWFGNMQILHFIVDTFTSEQPPCNCGRDSCCAESCECNCSDPNCTCCTGSVKYDTVYIDLPPAFVQSKNSNKRVSILIARIFDLVNECPIESSMHSDLVRTDASADHYCCTTNVLYSFLKTYYMGDNKGKFEVWFRKMNGNIIDLAPEKTRIVIEFVLEF